MRTGYKPHIGVVIWLNQEYGRRVLTGVVDYATTHALGSIEVLDAGAVRERRKAVAAADGLVAVLGHEEGKLIGGLPEPKVVVPHLSGASPYLTVATDAREVGHIAAEHMLSLGLRHLAMVPSVPRQAFAEFEAGVRQPAEAVGAEVIVQPPFREIAEVAAWCAGLPVPCGIVAQRDNVASGAIDYVRAVGRRVPEDIAVMGVENDIIYCMTHDPCLTSVVVPAEHLGWLAAQTLERRLTTGTAESVAVPPTGVIARESTQVTSACDPVLSDAIHYMRAQIDGCLDIDALAKRAGVSRRTLEHHFSRRLGCSIQEHMNGLRLDRALALLRTTNAPVKKIALSVGFVHSGNFTRFIRVHTGMTPSRFRQDHGQRGMS